MFRGHRFGMRPRSQNIHLMCIIFVLSRQSVTLNCLVDLNGSSDVPSVSWFRGTGELQLLTYEETTIVQDERFVVRHGIQRENNWALQIKNLDKTADAGLYQCQATSGTETPQSQFYQLNIVEPEVNILGAPDLAVKLGAPINLNCVISHTADQMQFIFWYRNERMINYDVANEKRGKIVMSKSTNSSSKQDTITSNLQIFSSKLSDSGNYTCQPSGARSASVYLHVLEADDKRLIMFQNDGHSLWPAASSQQHQTNSAVSFNLIRADRGQMYAVFLVFVIFSSWFNLVVQVQTGISLFLLAVIGLLLGRVTDNTSKQPAHEFADVRRAQQSSGRPISGQLKCDRERHFSNDDDDEVFSKHQDEQHEQAGTVDDPLLERANGAIKLLKTINSCASDNSTTCSIFDSSTGNEDLDASQTSAKSALLCAEMTRRQWRTKERVFEGTKTSSKQEQQLKHQASPSAGSASSNDSHASSTSTGYNTDSNCKQAHNVELLCGHDDLSSPFSRSEAAHHLKPAADNGLDGTAKETHQMIELLNERTEPTAIRLVLQRIDQGTLNLPENDWTSFSLRRSSDGQLEVLPLGAPVAPGSRAEPTQSANNNCDEHYSRPTNKTSKLP